jgi:PAS domain S-box-containing protein
MSVTRDDARGAGASLRERLADPAPLGPGEGEAQFRELMAHLRQVFWIKNAADDGLIYVSPACATIAGRDCGGLLGDFRNFLEAVHPDDRERVARVIEGQRDTGGYDAEYRILRPDGTVRWIRARSYPVRDAEGRIVRFAGIAEDVTERRSLEEDRARLAAIVEYSEDAVIGMSADCVVIAWNRGAERQYGYAAEEIIGCSLSVLFPPERYPEYQRILETVRRGEAVASRAGVRRRKDGTLFDVSANIFPIEARNRELVGVSKISRDVTAIKQLEGRYLQAQKMEVVGQLAAGIAHDFNNLLSVILGGTDLMLLSLDEDAPLRGNVEMIRQAAERAAGLTQQLLVLSRKGRAAPVVLDPNTIVANLDKMLRLLLPESIVLTVVRAESVGRVKADAGRLGQLLLNLVINARDAMPDGGRLSVTTRDVVPDDESPRARPGTAPPAYVVLAVGDTGTGMTDEVKAHLFEPFFTTKPVGRGTGLGLATCDAIVKQIGGHIDVESEPGVGTTFSVFLPAVEGPLDASMQSYPAWGAMPPGTERCAT